jgi:hypothetical protein
VALATGDDQWSWLTPWAWVLGVPFYDTAEFCAQGPSTVPQIQLSDFFTPTIGQGALWDKIGRIYRDRVFGAFCEVATGTELCEYTEFDSDTSWSDANSVQVVHVTVRPGVSQINITFTPSNASRYSTYVQTGFQAQIFHSASTVYTGAFGPGAGNSSGLQAAGSLEFWFSPQIVGETIAGRLFIVQVAACEPGATHDPTPQPPVIGALEPTHKTYASIADLGAELDHLEDKGDQLRQSLAFLIQQQASPSLAPDDVLPGPDVPTDPPVDIPPGAIAAVVTVSAIPTSSSVELLEPQRYSRLGMITLGTADGWLPSMHIEHNPQLVVPLPPWAKLIRVSVFPPATATVRFLTKL